MIIIVVIIHSWSSFLFTSLTSTHSYPGGDEDHGSLLGDDVKKTPLDKSWKDRASAPVSGVRSAWP